MEAMATSAMCLALEWVLDGTFYEDAPHAMPTLVPNANKFSFSSSIYNKHLIRCGPTLFIINLTDYDCMFITNPIKKSIDCNTH